MSVSVEWFVVCDGRDCQVRTAGTTSPWGPVPSALAAGWTRRRDLLLCPLHSGQQALPLEVAS